MISVPAATRNKEPILSVLRQVIRTEAPLRALEIASGSGEHVSHFAQHFKNINFQPSELSPEYFSSVESFCSNYNLNNVNPSILIDASSDLSSWPESVSCMRGQYDLIFCINMIHISSWNCTEGLFKAAGQLLKERTGLLVTYGPYGDGGVISPESNVAFDQSLRSQNPEWGVRDIVELVNLAKINNMQLYQEFYMPANNKTLVFKKMRR